MFRPVQNLLVCLVMLASLAYSPSETKAQFEEVILWFIVDPDSSPDFPGYGVFCFCFDSDLVVTMPNGTVMDFGQWERFDTFQMLQAASVGTWTAELGNAALAFDIPRLEQEDVGNVEVGAPQDGSTFLCGETIVTEIVQPKKGEFVTHGCSVRTFGGVFLELECSELRAILAPGENSANLQLQLQTTQQVAGLIQNVQGDTDVVSVRSEVNMTVYSESVFVEVVENEYLGDGNRDGTLNLKDVQLFVDAIVGQRYEFDLDINKDQELNLADVQPFVELFID